jgi:CMP-N,N'-diacetyllegionaminic acid synthase
LVGESVFQNKNVVAIIPARGGSKGIPRKNIVLIGRKPLIAYTIEEARKSKYIDRVIVSTDDKEIATIARKYGAEVPFLRPKSLAKDTSPSLLVVLHALDYLEKKEKYSPDIIVFLQPTSPFRKVEHIDAAIKKIKSADAVAGISEVKDHPYFMVQKKNGFLEPFLKIKKRPLRRQDVPKLYVFNASVYVAKGSYYKKVNKTDPVAPVYNGRVKGVVMDEISSIDINTPLDILLADAVTRKGGKSGRHPDWQ